MTLKSSTDTKYQMEKFITDSFSLSYVYLEVWGYEKALWSFNCGENKKKIEAWPPHGNN